MYTRLLFVTMLSLFSFCALGAEARYVEVAIQAISDTGLSMEHSAIVEVGKKVRVAKTGAEGIRLDYRVVGLSVDDRGASVARLEGMLFNKRGVEKWSLGMDTTMVLALGQTGSNRLTSKMGGTATLNVRLNSLTADTVRARLGGVLPEIKACPEESTDHTQVKAYCAEWPCIGPGTGDNCCSAECADGSGNTMTCCGAITCCDCGVCCSPGR